jgi:hypothetical protein
LPRRRSRKILIRARRTVAAIKAPRRISSHISGYPQHQADQAQEQGHQPGQDALPHDYGERPPAPNSRRMAATEATQGV